jgi:hypothetical protein
MAIAQFVEIREKKGFCINYIKYVIILEMNIDVSDEVTNGIFFMNYCQVLDC